MQVYFNKKTDEEISKRLLKLMIMIDNRKVNSKEEELIIKTEYKTLKWVVGEQNEK